MLMQSSAGTGDTSKQTLERKWNKTHAPSLLKVPVILQPHAWWQHAIGAVISERCDLLRLGAGHKLPASTLWVLQREYIAAYLNQQRAPGLAALLSGWTSWRKVILMKVSRCSLSHSTLNYMHAKILDCWSTLQNSSRPHVQCPISLTQQAHPIDATAHTCVTMRYMLLQP